MVDQCFETECSFLQDEHTKLHTPHRGPDIIVCRVVCIMHNCLPESGDPLNGIAKEREEKNM